MTQSDNARTHEEAVHAGFAALVNLDPAAQRSGLESLDEDVRAEVKRLLGHDRAMGVPVDAVSSVRDMIDRAFDEPAALTLPAAIGPYAVKGRISTGGMSTVFECVDEHGTKAAVKVLSPTLCTRETLRRFEHEADVLTRLHEPGVVGIVGHGTVNLGLGEQPYIAMELVEGVELDTYAREQGLSEQEKLGLVAEIARTVHRLHLRGVVHRDLKPANILVTADSIPTIVDFGIARARWASKTTLTLAGQLPGTIGYMSPEQAAGADVDPRSDTYSLGAMLYELLTGQTPFSIDNGGIARALSAITNDVPRRPRSINPTIRGDAELVVLRALAKLPDDRYQSAAEFAAELERVIRGDPVVARRPGRLVRVRRWARRHPAGMRTILAGVAGLSVIGATLGVLGVRAAAAERRARAWESATGEAFDVLERMFLGLSRNHFGPDVTATDLLDSIAGQVEELAHTPEARASALSNVGYAYFLVEDYATSVKWLEQSVEAAAEMHGLGSGEFLLESYRLSLSHTAAGNPTAALAVIDRALAHARKPETPAYALRLSEVRASRGNILCRLGRFEEGRREYRQASDRAFTTGGPDSTRRLKAMLGLARANIALGDHEEALVLIDEVIERNLRIRSESHARTWRAHVFRAEAFNGLGRLGESETEYREALRVLDATYPQDHPASAYARAGLARTLIDAGRAGEARDLLRQVVSDEPVTWWLGNYEASSYAADLALAESLLP